MKIAQPFRAGVSGCAGASSPIGTTEANPSHANERVHFSRPDGTECTSRTSHPAMKKISRERIKSQLFEQSIARDG